MSTHSPTSPEEAESTAVRAVVRVRPFFPSERGENSQAPHCCLSGDGRTIHCVRHTKSVKSSLASSTSGGGTHTAGEHQTTESLSSFGFDRVFWSLPPEDRANDEDRGEPTATQDTVFDYIGTQVASDAFSGYHICLFAYGQTGSGKTHTVIGNPVEPGITPRLLTSIFEYIAAQEERDPYTKYTVELSAVEIYNEKPRDLLASRASSNSPLGGDLEDTDSDPSGSDIDVPVHQRGASSISESSSSTRPRSPVPSDYSSPAGSSPSHPFKQSAATAEVELRVRQHPEYGTYLCGLRREEVDDERAARVGITQALAHRTVAATKMNDRSSRSHAMVQITLRSESRLRGQKKSSTISLIDLAGSERIKLSGVTGQHLAEAKNINLSLTTLRRVIDTMLENQSRLEKGIHPLFPPYRESLLTMLLSEPLGGNAKTTMLATVAPHADYAEDTLNTLRYASRAMSIVCKVRVNREETKVVVGEIAHEVDHLKGLMRDAETESEKVLPDLRTHVDKKTNVGRVMVHLVGKRQHAVDDLLGQIRPIDAESKEVNERLEALKRLQVETDQVKEESAILGALTEEDNRRLDTLAEEDAKCETERKESEAEIEELLADPEVQASLERVRLLRKKRARLHFVNAMYEVKFEALKNSLADHKEELETQAADLSTKQESIEGGLSEEGTVAERVVGTQQKVNDIALDQVEAFEKNIEIGKRQREIAEVRRLTEVERGRSIEVDEESAAEREKFQSDCTFYKRVEDKMAAAIARLQNQSEMLDEEEAALRDDVERIEAEIGALEEFLEPTELIALQSRNDLLNSETETTFEDVEEIERRAEEGVAHRKAEQLAREISATEARVKHEEEMVAQYTKAIMQIQMDLKGSLASIHTA